MVQTTSAKTLQEIILAILDLAEADKATPIDGYVWGRWINDIWYVAVNGTDEPGKIVPSNTAMPHTLEPGAMAVWYGDWLAGELTFGGGWFAARQNGASPETFIEAIKAEVRG